MIKRTQAFVAAATQQDPIIYPLVPAFRAHKSDKTLQPHIIRAFLKEIEVEQRHLDLGSIVLEDGSAWRLLLESKDELRETNSFGSCYCIVSFQLWADGKTWAVARKARP